MEVGNAMTQRCEAHGIESSKTGFVKHNTRQAALYSSDCARRWNDSGRGFVLIRQTRNELHPHSIHAIRGGRVQHE